MVFCVFSFRFCSSVKVTAVDIDEAILDVAKTYFGLQTEGDKLDLVVADGLEYLKSAKVENKKYDAILFDVDSKDSSLGISCPPKQFIEKEALDNVKECLLEDGIFVLNLVCRDDSLKGEIIETLKRTFAVAVSYKLEDEVNEIVFCSKSKKADLKAMLKDAMEDVNGAIKKQKLNGGDLVDVQEVEGMLKELTL